MGVYDTVLVPCPKCGRPHEAQSKGADRPCLDRYELNDAPLKVLADVNRHAPFRCDNCGSVFKVELTLTPRLVEVD